MRSSRHKFRAVAVGFESALCRNGKQSDYDRRGRGAAQDLIHADIGVTRALVEKGWAPKEYQIGLSGRAVQPELYIALGISGASQHLIGLRKCKNIIAVNRDANATVFQYATVGIVADFYDVLPRLSQMILNRRKDG